MNDTPENPPVARVDYMEFAAPDLPKIRAFYEAALGWTFTDWGGQYLSFHDGSRAEAGGIRTQDPGEDARPLPVLYTDDIEHAKTRIQDAGGELLGLDVEFPGGKRFHFRDPAGTELAVWTKV